MQQLAGHRCSGEGPAVTAWRSKAPGAAWGCWDERSPDQVCEASVQAHGGGGAAEHGQDALQVQQLQLLSVTAEEQNHTETHAK